MNRFSGLLVVASGTVIGLAIPSAIHSAPGDGGYVVERDDYLVGIARQRGVTLGDLLVVNGLTLTSVIHPGQQLAIPAGANPSAPQGPTTGSTYTVRSGDSLFGIARRLSVPVQSLLAANRLTLTSVIHPGQQLAIPAGANPSAPHGGPNVESIIRDVWPDYLEERALTIAWRESRYQSAAQNLCCSGLFQLYYDVHRAWMTDLGIDSRDDLYDPRTNATAAYELYRRAGGWGPWSLGDD